MAGAERPGLGAGNLPRRAKPNGTHQGRSHWQDGARPPDRCRCRPLAHPASQGGHRRRWYPQPPCGFASGAGTGRFGHSLTWSPAPQHDDLARIGAVRDRRSDRARPGRPIIRADLARDLRRRGGRSAASLCRGPRRRYRTLQELVGTPAVATVIRSQAASSHVPFGVRVSYILLARRSTETSARRPCPAGEIRFSLRPHT